MCERLVVPAIRSRDEAAANGGDGLVDATLHGHQLAV